MLEMLNRKSQPARSYEVGRNEPCPCDSGRKFKQCCGRVQPEHRESYYYDKLRDKIKEYITKPEDYILGPLDQKEVMNNLIPLLEQAVEDHPINHDFVELLAWTRHFLDLDRGDTIRKLWNLQGTDMHEELFTYHIQSLFSDGEYEKAREILESVRDQIEDKLALQFNYGLVLIRTGEPDRGWRHLQKARESGKLNNSASKAALKELWENGLPDRALEVYIEDYEQLNDMPWEKERICREIEEELQDAFEGDGEGDLFRRLRDWSRDLKAGLNTVHKLQKQPEDREASLKLQEMTAQNPRLPRACLYWLFSTEREKEGDAAGEFLAEFLRDCRAIDQQQKQEALTGLYHLLVKELLTRDEFKRAGELAAGNFNFSTRDFFERRDKRNDLCVMLLAARMASGQVNKARDMLVGLMEDVPGKNPGEERQRRLELLRIILSRLVNHTFPEENELIPRLVTALEKSLPKLPGPSRRELYTLYAYSRIQFYKYFITFRGWPARETLPQLFPKETAGTAAGYEDSGAALILLEVIRGAAGLEDEEFGEELEAVLSSPVHLKEDVWSQLDARLWQARCRSEEPEKALTADVEDILSRHELDAEEEYFYRYLARAITGEYRKAFEVFCEYRDILGKKFGSGGTNYSYFDGDYFLLNHAHLENKVALWFKTIEFASPEEIRDEMPETDEKLLAEMKEWSAGEIAAELRADKNSRRIFTALQAASRRPGELAPHLMDILRKTRSQIEDGEKIEFPWASIYAMLLLAEFRQKEAFSLIIDIISNPEEVIEELLGDLLLEEIPRVLLSVYNGELELLKQLIEDRESSQYSRTAALATLVLLVCYGLLEQKEIEEYFAYLYREGLERKQSFLWGNLVDCTATLKLESLRSNAEECFTEGYINEQVFDRDEILARFDRAEVGERELRRGPVKDAARTAKRWIKPSWYPGG